MLPTRQTKPRHERTPSDNSQREDLIMKRKTERAAPGRREKKIAKWSIILVERHRTRRRARTLAAKADRGPRNQSAKRIVAQTALSPIGCHPFCSWPKQVRSMGTFQMIESRNNHRSSLPSRGSPSSITTLTASKSQAVPSLRLFSADSRERNTMHRSASANEIF